MAPPRRKFLTSSSPGCTRGAGSLTVPSAERRASPPAKRGGDASRAENTLNGSGPRAASGAPAQLNDFAVLLVLFVDAAERQGDAGVGEFGVDPAAGASLLEDVGGR